MTTLSSSEVGRHQFGTEFAFFINFVGILASTVNFGIECFHVEIEIFSNNFTDMK